MSKFINESTYRYNSKTDSPAYAGYMYGSVIGTRENNIKNEVDSDIKQLLDSWYEDNLNFNSYENFIFDSGFCNDRSITTGTGEDVTTLTVFGANSRANNYTAALRCENKNGDLFTTSQSLYGNKSLKYPIGLPTYDELAFSGLNSDIANNLGWTFSSPGYWTMSPSWVDPTWQTVSAYKILDDKIYFGYDLTWKYGVRPVISLKSDVKISSGIGTVNEPFVIDTNN